MVILRNWHCTVLSVMSVTNQIASDNSVNNSSVLLVIYLFINVSLLMLYVHLMTNDVIVVLSNS